MSSGDVGGPPVADSSVAQPHGAQPAGGATGGHPVLGTFGRYRHPPGTTGAELDDEELEDDELEELEELGLEELELEMLGVLCDELDDELDEELELEELELEELELELDDEELDEDDADGLELIGIAPPQLCPWKGRTLPDQSRPSKTLSTNGTSRKRNRTS